MLLDPAVGPLYSTRCGSALFCCCVDHPSRVSGPHSSLPLRQQSSLPQPKSSGFLSLGSSVTVMFTLLVGFVQVLVGAAALRRCVFVASCLSFLWRTVRPRTCCLLRLLRAQRVIWRSDQHHAVPSSARSCVELACTLPAPECGAIVLRAYCFGVWGALPPKLSHLDS